jgi:hypothetical protein
MENFRMMDAETEDKWKPRIIKSFRLSRSQLELIERECASRNIAFSEFVRQSAMLNIKHGRTRSTRN